MGYPWCLTEYGNGTVCSGRILKIVISPQFTLFHVFVCLKGRGKEAKRQKDNLYCLNWLERMLWEQKDGKVKQIKNFKDILLSRQMRLL